MAITHHASAELNSPTATTTGTIYTPSTVLAGDDLYVLFVSRDHASGTALATVTDDDTGGNTWTRLGGTTDRRINLFWKKATSGTYSRIITIAGCVGSMSGGLSIFRGCYPIGDPTTNLVFEDNASADETQAGFTPSYANSWVCLGIVNDTNDTIAVTLAACTTPGTMEPELWQHDSIGGSDCYSIFFAKEQSGGPSATGNFTWSQTNSTTKSVSFAIRPDPRTRYWVGGTASWDTTAGSKWAVTTGGTAGATKPTSADNVFFDANSGSGTVTFSACACDNLNFTGFTGTIAGSARIDCYGSLTASSGMTWSHTGGINFFSTGSETITCAGKIIGDVEFNGAGGTWVCQDAFSCAGYTWLLTQGTFDANDYNVTSTIFRSNNSNTRAIIMGSGTWTTSSSEAWNFANGTGLTVTPETSTLLVVGSGTKTFSGGGKTYYNLENGLNASSTLVIVGANTFNVFDIAKTNNSQTIHFTAGTTTTVGQIKKTAGTGHTLTSATAATHTISDTSGTNSLSNTTISYSIATGGASFQAYTTNTNVDGGNNTGWVFSPVTFNSSWARGSNILIGVPTS